MTANRLAQLHYYRGDWYATERVLQQALGFAHELGLQNDPALDSNYRMLADQALLQGKEQEQEPAAANRSRGGKVAALAAKFAGGGEALAALPAKGGRRSTRRWV